jgi:radical SAM superfamily enzyme
MREVHFEQGPIRPPCDAYSLLLQYIKKGVTSKEHIDAWEKVKESGISLSEYVILGLGGKGMWREHAIETAKVLNQMNPDFIRVRTLKVLKMMSLSQKIEKGEFFLLGDDEIVTEEKLLIENLEGITSTFVSNHILNFFQEVEGKLPEGKEKMLNLIDRYLSFPKEEKDNFRLGRRMGVYQSVEDLSNPELRKQVERVLQQIEGERPGGVEKVFFELTESFI